VPDHTSGYCEATDPDVACHFCGDPPPRHERELAMQRRLVAAVTALAEAAGRAGTVASHAVANAAANDDAQEGRAATAASESFPIKPLSVSAAAKLLCVSKSRTLLPAIAAGIVRTVGHGKRRRVPPDELRRLAAEGINPPRKASTNRVTARKPGPPVDLSAELARVAAMRPEPRHP
jgi:hypothetical protein